VESVTPGLDEEMDLLRNLKVLGLGKDASLEEVKRAYRKMCKVWHPDRFQDDADLRADAEEKMREINAAYECVMPEMERRQEEMKRDWQQAAANAQEDLKKAQARAKSATEAKKQAEQLARQWKAEADRLKAEVVSVKQSQANAKLGKGLAVFVAVAIGVGILVGGVVGSQNQTAALATERNTGYAEGYQAGTSEGYSRGLAAGKSQATPTGKYIRMDHPEYTDEANFKANAANTWYVISLLENPVATERSFAPYVIDAYLTSNSGATAKQLKTSSLPYSSWSYTTRKKK
jgi:hypothetical protein